MLTLCWNALADKNTIKIYCSWSSSVATNSQKIQMLSGFCLGIVCNELKANLYKFSLKNFGAISLFCRVNDIPVLDFWWHLPWVPKPGWILHLCSSLPTYNVFLRFTSSVPPADSSQPTLQISLFVHVLAHICTLVGVRGTVYALTNNLFWLIFSTI